MTPTEAVQAYISCHTSDFAASDINNWSGCGHDLASLNSALHQAKSLCKVRKVGTYNGRLLWSNKPLGNIDALFYQFVGISVDAARRVGFML